MNRVEKIKYGLLRRESYHGFLVRIYRDRIAIEAPTDRPVSWEMLQAIKSAVLGPEVEALEYYPPESKVVNLRNVRHLWYGPVHVRNHPEFT